MDDCLPQLIVIDTLAQQRSQRNSVFLTQAQM
jgi:hypothetical protein